MAGNVVNTGAILKLIIDTNIVVPLEPTSQTGHEPLSDAAVRFVGLCHELGHYLFVHPASMLDFNKDSNRERYAMRSLLLQKYPFLPDPPRASNAMVSVLGTPAEGSNDWIDNQIIASLVANAVDFLVTEDRGIHRKIRRLGLSDRVLNIAEAVTMLLALSDKVPDAPPAVQATKAYSIQSTEPILDSFREDYPDFDSWFSKCQREHRQTWLIRNANELLGLCIVKHEQTPPCGLDGKTLKICSLKVGEQHNGLYYGELLLKAVFDYTFQNRYEWLYLTVFAKHEKLIHLLGDFGFAVTNTKTMLGELVLIKRLKPNRLINDETALDYNVKYGPHHFKIDGVSWYLVPIQDHYADALFPETAKQPSLFTGALPHGNSIKKAYLCNSPIRSITPGSILVFYRSGHNTGAITLGVVERTVVSQQSQKIAYAVGKRTVYSLKSIESMCDKKKALAVLFRQVRAFSPFITADELLVGGLFTHPPQSIMQVKNKGIKWLQSKIKM